MRTTILAALSLAVASLAPASAQAGTCTVYASTEAVSCDSATTGHVWVDSTASTGFVLGIDMEGYSIAILRGSIASGSGWLLNLGDSETNNGYCGDGATTSNDSELWITNGNVYACDSDRGGSDYLLSWTGAFASTSNFQILVADGNAIVQNRSTGVQKEISADTFFQVDGDEPDAEAGANDTLLWLGLNRVISGPGSRVGSGMGNLTITLY